MRRLSLLSYPQIYVPPLRQVFHIRLYPGNGILFFPPFPHKFPILYPLRKTGLPDTCFHPAGRIFPPPGLPQFFLFDSARYIFLPYHKRLHKERQCTGYPTHRHFPCEARPARPFPAPHDTYRGLNPLSFLPYTHLHHLLYIYLLVSIFPAFSVSFGKRFIPYPDRYALRWPVPPAVPEEFLPPSPCWDPPYSAPACLPPVLPSGKSAALLW